MLTTVIVMEFNTVSRAYPAPSFFSDCPESLTSYAIPHESAKLTAANTDRSSDGRHVELVTLDKRDAMEMEFSSQSHLIIMLPDGISGGFEWSNNNQRGRLSSVAPNTILFNPAREYLWIKKPTSRRCRILLLIIDPALVNRLGVGDVNVAELQFCQQIGIEDQRLRLTLAAIEQEIGAPGLNSRLYVDNLLMLLLTQLMRCASNFATPRQPSYVKGGLQNWRLKRAIELLEANQSKTPSLAELAGPLRLHPAAFCRAFKQSTGLSPHRYSLERRVNRAKEMMKDRKRKLTEIALDCGFSSSSHFSVVFKRVTGASPRNYRLSFL
jgi:AraC family transcriptional regulator